MYIVTILFIDGNNYYLTKDGDISLEFEDAMLFKSEYDAKSSVPEIYSKYKINCIHKLCFVQILTDLGWSYLSGIDSWNGEYFYCNNEFDAKHFSNYDNAERFLVENKNHFRGTFVRIVVIKPVQVSLFDFSDV